jgi:hypothetical protein
MQGTSPEGSPKAQAAAGSAPDQLHPLVFVEQKIPYDEGVVLNMPEEKVEELREEGSYGHEYFTAANFQTYAFIMLTTTGVVSILSDDPEQALEKWSQVIFDMPVAYLIGMLLEPSARFLCEFLKHSLCGLGEEENAAQLIVEHDQKQDEEHDNNKSTAQKAKAFFEFVFKDAPLFVLRELPHPTAVLATLAMPYLGQLERIHPSLQNNAPELNRIVNLCLGVIPVVAAGLVLCAKGIEKKYKENFPLVFKSGFAVMALSANSLDIFQQSCELIAESKESFGKGRFFQNLMSVDTQVALIFSPLLPGLLNMAYNWKKELKSIESREERLSYLMLALWALNRILQVSKREEDYQPTDLQMAKVAIGAAITILISAVGIKQVQQHLAHQHHGREHHDDQRHHVHHGDNRGHQQQASSGPLVERVHSATPTIALPPPAAPSMLIQHVQRQGVAGARAASSPSERTALLSLSASAINADSASAVGEVSRSQHVAQPRSS